MFHASEIKITFWQIFLRQILTFHKTLFEVKVLGICPPQLPSFLFFFKKKKKKNLFFRHAENYHSQFLCRLTIRF